MTINWRSVGNFSYRANTPVGKFSMDKFYWAGVDFIALMRDGSFVSSFIGFDDAQEYVKYLIKKELKQ